MAGSLEPLGGDYWRCGDPKNRTLDLNLVRLSVIHKQGTLKPFEHRLFQLHIGAVRMIYASSKMLFHMHYNEMEESPFDYNLSTNSARQGL